MDIISDLTFEFYWIVFSKCPLSPLHTELCFTSVESTALFCIWISLSFQGWPVPKFMEHCTLKFILYIHQEHIFHTSVACSTVKWNYFQEIGIGLLHHIALACWHYVMSNGFIDADILPIAFTDFLKVYYLLLIFSVALQASQKECRFTFASRRINLKSAFGFSSSLVLKLWISLFKK